MKRHRECVFVCVCVYMCVPVPVYVCVYMFPVGLQGYRHITGTRLCLYLGVY